MMKSMLTPALTQKIQSHQNVLIGSLIWSLVTIFGFGEARRIIAYEGSQWTLFFLQIAVLLFATSLYAFFFTTFFKKNPWFSGFSLVTAILISGYFPFAGNLQLYVLVGNFLRDSVGINIFSMDYAGWAISTFFIQVPLFYFIIYPLVQWGWVKNKQSSPVIMSSHTSRTTSTKSKTKKRKSRK